MFMNSYKSFVSDYKCKSRSMQGAGTFAQVCTCNKYDWFGWLTEADG